MREKEKITDEELVLSLKNGDCSAMGVLYDYYSAALFGIIIRIVGSQKNAEDVLQAVFIKIWRDISSYHSSKGKLYTWLYTIARNVALDSVALQPSHVGMKTGVNKMKPEHKELIEMLYFEGYTPEKAAKELNVPLSSVKTRVRAAINRLREVFTAEHLVN